MSDSVFIPYGYEMTEGMLIRSDTGEVIRHRLVALPDESNIYTPVEKEIIERKKKEQEERKLRKKTATPFIFVKKKIDFEGIPPAMITKLIYLSTYMQYSDNKLMLSPRKEMTKKDLADVLGISPRNAVNFWCSLSPLFISEDSTGGLLLNTELFKRGSLAKNMCFPYQKIFNNGVRKLYKAANGKYHKQMGYLFELLPFISVEYNVLCKNPYVKDIDAVELLSISEFCNLIGYGVENIDKLKRIYSNIRFPVGDHYELFCKMIYDGIHSKDAVVCINPNILYSGANSKRMDVLKLSFRT